MEERLQKILAARGVASRRAAEKLMEQGRVTVNGQVITAMGSMADPDGDLIQVDGMDIAPSTHLVYIALNKPLGIVSTCKDTHQRPTIIGLGLPEDLRLYPVGRLDMDSSGLLILTNDGDFAYKLTHPSQEYYKTYLVECRGHVTDEDGETLRQGIQLTDGKTLPAQVEIIAYSPNRTRLTVAIREGKNRQIRRMLGAVHHPVISLQRIAVGPLQLGDLPEGKWRYLNQEEIDQLLAQ